MNWEAWAALVLLVLILYTLARNLAGADVVMMGAVAVILTLSLWSDRFPTPADAVRVFGNEGLLTVGMLFIVAAGLTETGALQMLTQRALGSPKSTRAALLRLTTPVIAASGFINNTPIVAMLMPIVTEWCRRIGLSPSKLLIPLSYAAVLGGVCTLIGTSTNLVLLGLMLDARSTDPSMPTLAMFTLTPVGLPVALAGGAFIVFFADRLLPARTGAWAFPDDPREYTLDMAVEPGSAVDGTTIEDAGLRQLPGLYLAAIERGGLRRVPVPPDEILRGGDLLTFVGVVDSVRDLQRVPGLVPATNQVVKLGFPRHVRFLAEAVVSSTSPLIGQTIREGRFRSRYEAVVIAVHRNGERVLQKIGDIVLRPGDTLLLETTRRFLNQHRNSRDFYLVSDVPGSRPLRRERAPMALAVLAGTVLLLIVGEPLGLGTFHAALLGALAMGLFRCLSADQARRSVDWATLSAIAGALVVGRAMESSGLAPSTAQAMLTVAQPFGPFAVLVGLYLLTMLFTEIVTNNAAVALVFPIAHSAASQLGVSFMPFAVVLAIAASCGFATPFGYQTHLMVYGAGGYRFSDYVRIGVPLDVLVMIVTVLLTPILFPF
jgi:di/tricarboxylate transporter